MAAPRGVVLPLIAELLAATLLAAAPPQPIMLGRSEQGRPIKAWHVGDASAERRVLVVGCIHGNECAGTAITRVLLRSGRTARADLWVVPNLNPDGFALGVRQNGRGVDLNRNFPSEWRRIGRRGDPDYPGPRPLSEREARIARNLVLRVRPDTTVWFHQPQGFVRAWGPSIPSARRYARVAGMRFAAIRWPPGTAANWQNHRFPRAAAFVVELPPGPVAAGAARRHVAAILALGSDA